MARFEIESLRAIIEYNAGAVGDNAATETFVHALNHRHPVPLIVRSRNIGGVFSRTSGNWPAARLSHLHLWKVEKQGSARLSIKHLRIRNPPTSMFQRLCLRF